MNCLIVLNPISGRGLAQKLLETILEGTPAIRNLCQKVGLDGLPSWKIISTTKDNVWLNRLEHELDINTENLVLVIGGDGTLRLVAICLYQASQKKSFSVSMVPIPSGRGNDFIRGLCRYSLKKGGFWKWAQASSWESQWIDLAQVNDHLFLNMASLGYGGGIIQKVHERHAVWSKTPAVYQVEGGIALLKMQECSCEIKENNHLFYQGPFFGAFIGNGKANGSGLFWTPQADLSDGKLNFFIFRKPGVLQMYRALQAVKKKRESKLTSKKCKAPKVIFEFDQPVDLEVDGEYLGKSQVYVFQCIPRALRICFCRTPFRNAGQ